MSRWDLWFVSRTKKKWTSLQQFNQDDVTDFNFIRFLRVRVRMRAFVAKKQ